MKLIAFRRVFCQFLVPSNKVYPKITNVSFNYSSRKGDLKKGNNKIFKSLSIHFLSGITITFSLINFSVLLLSFHDRDVEKIPGTNYTIEQVVKGSYH